MSWPSQREENPNLEQKKKTTSQSSWGIG